MQIFFFHLLIWFFFFLKIKYLARLYSKQHFCWKHRSSLSFRINEIKKYKIIIKYNKKIPRRRKKTWQYNVYYSNYFFFISSTLKILYLWAKKKNENTWIGNFWLTIVNFWGFLSGSCKITFDFFYGIRKKKLKKIAKKSKFIERGFFKEIN